MLLFESDKKGEIKEFIEIIKKLGEIELVKPKDEIVTVLYSGLAWEKKKIES